MNLLLDTHVLLWWLEDSNDLPKRLRDEIVNGENEVFVSSVSIWEIVIKKSLGKIKVPKNFLDIVSKERFFQLDISWEHAFTVQDLPAIHQDPFDRLLIAQALCERLTIVTQDKYIKKYKVSTL